MFRVEFFCDDRKVGDALRNLLGIAVGVPVATPVINAEQKGGKVQSQSNGKLIEMFAHHISSSKADSVTSKEIQAWLSKIGMSPMSSSYVIKHSVSRGVLKKIAIGNYRVIRALPKPTKKGTTHG